MGTTTRMFSNVSIVKPTDGWLELHYDNVIRAVMPLGPLAVAPASGSPPGKDAPGAPREGMGITALACPTPDCIRGVPPPAQAPVSGSLLGDDTADAILQGTGITTLACPTPDCLRGVPPDEQLPPSDQVQFWMQLPAAASIAASDAGGACLLVPGSAGSIAIPIFDASLGTGVELCGALKEYRTRVELLECVAFHVYLIAVASESLAALEGKRIALPIPSHYVVAAAASTVATDDAAATNAGEPMRSSA